jgi:hypothetical protein
MSALWFAVQIPSADDPDWPQGKQRPVTLPDDPKARKKALDVDGEMPDWMANAIVAAMIETFPKPEDHPHIFQGDGFQSAIDSGLLTKVVESVTGSAPDRPFPELLQDIAPTPPMSVPNGFPLPWQVQTMYRIMITFYKFQFNGTWELQKPRKPDLVIFPPASDIENLLQPPDLSGIDLSDPVDDVCGLFVALLEQAIKNLDAALKLLGDLIKMAASPGTYLLRLGLYEVAMLVWDTATRTHEILAHTGFVTPHAEQRYANGELRLPKEIDDAIVTLGGTVDEAFRAALAAAFDPLGNLDTDQNVIGTGHSVSDSNFPYYPVLRYRPNNKIEGWEFHRPWAWPDKSRMQVNGAPDAEKNTPSETYSPAGSFGKGPDVYTPLRAGPYRPSTTPEVLFRTNAPVDSDVRSAYEMAQTPLDTDLLNEANIGPRELGLSPLGDPIPFSAHLIGQLVNDTGYSTQFNLDSDRAFAYLTWDWVRDETTEGKSQPGIFGITHQEPIQRPEGDPGWAQGGNPLLLRYKDPPKMPPPIEVPR